MFLYFGFCAKYTDHMDTIYSLLFVLEWGRVNPVHKVDIIDFTQHFYSEFKIMYQMFFFYPWIHVLCWTGEIWNMHLQWPSIFGWICWWDLKFQQWPSISMCEERSGRGMILLSSWRHWFRKNSVQNVHAKMQIPQVQRVFLVDNFSRSVWIVGL